MNVLLGIVAATGFYYLFLRKGTPPPASSYSVPYDHPPGDTVPIKVQNTFGRVSDYINSPFDPLNNSSYIEFYDADNLLRRDYITTGGKRIVTYPHSTDLRDRKEGEGNFGAKPGQKIGTERPFRATINEKNLNKHSSIWYDKR